MDLGPFLERTLDHRGGFVELAFRLGRVAEIPPHADRCMALRRELGDSEGLELCREMAERYLRQAGRADLARPYGRGWLARVTGWLRRR